VSILRLNGSSLQRKKILILIGVFFATLPISYLITAFGPQAIIIAVLTPLFFMFIAWHLIEPIENQKDLIPIVVFFATLPLSLIIYAFNPLSRLITDILISTRIGVLLAAYVPALLFTILTSLFFAFISWFFVKSKKNSKVQTEGEK